VPRWNQSGFVVARDENNGQASRGGAEVELRVSHDASRTGWLVSSLTSEGLVDDLPAWAC
jgi:hypothetical protein